MEINVKTKIPICVIYTEIAATAAEYWDDRVF